jgi:hypothetical protein
MPASKASQKGSQRRKTRRGRLGSFAGRHINAITVVGGLTGIAALLVALLALVPAFRSADISEDDGNWLKPNALSVIGLDVSSTVELKEEQKSAGKVVDSRRVNVPAAKIILHNSGDQSVLVRTLRVHVSRAWAPEACQGTGSRLNTVLYDFTLPRNIKKSRLPLDLSQDINFEVDPQANDYLAVTIGENNLGEAGWPMIVAATAELVLTDGTTLPTGEFVLMNGNQADRVANLVGAGTTPDQAACVKRNVGVLQEALAAPGKHTGSIQRLLNRVQGKETGTPSGASGTWVAQLGSYPESTMTSSELKTLVAGMERKLGVQLETARSSAYGSLNSGYWVTFYQGSFANGHEALTFCSEHGITGENACLGRYFSAAEADRSLSCRFDDPPDATSCKRP